MQNSGVRGLYGDVYYEHKTAGNRVILVLAEEHDYSYLGLVSEEGIRAFEDAILEPIFQPSPQPDYETQIHDPVV